MQISIAMATWQGERHLPRQLASVLGQTRLPDELVIVDDASDDATVDIVDEFAAHAPFKVHLHRNEHRQGSTGTFTTAIEAAEGDLIVLADQDDLWLPQKLARLEAAFRERPETTFAFTDALLVDDADAIGRETMWEVRGFTPALQERVRSHPFAELSHRWLATGCTMAFRADLRSLLLPIPTDLTDLFEPMIHDRWLSLVLAAAGPVAVIDEPLVCYRLHATQQIGLANVTAAQSVSWRLLDKVTMHRDRVEAARRYQLVHLEEVRSRIVDAGLGTPRTMADVDGAIDHLRMRLENLDRGQERLGAIVQGLLRGGYHRYARGLSSVAIDLVKS